MPGFASGLCGFRTFSLHIEPGLIMAASIETLALPQGSQLIDDESGTRT